MQPIDAAWTSDRQTAVRQARRAAIQELSAGGRLIGRAAREAFDELPLDLAHPGVFERRLALLEIAARADPEGSRERLVRLVREYVPDFDLVRAEAARLLAETSPERAAELYRELLTGVRNVTLPPAELLLRYWIVATRSLESEGPKALDEAHFLADIATDFERTADLRYVAIAELGRTPGPIATGALRVLLIESGQDGYIRRKALQALVEALPQDELCAILTEVADKESDPGFAPFLLDALNRSCP